jgi:hypothetical protein
MKTVKVRERRQNGWNRVAVSGKEQKHKPEFGHFTKTRRVGSLLQALTLL